MNEAASKAGVLIEALGWIRRFHRKLIVIKLGGSALENEQTVRRLLTDVIFMHSVGVQPILIHGGGKSINAAMSTAGLEPRWVQGRRYTDEATLDIVARVLAGEICESLVREIRAQGGRAMGLSFLTQNCLIGQRLELPGENGEKIDLGLVGEVTHIDRELLETVCDAGIIPVIPSVALDSNGKKLNVNADTAAASVARIMGSEKLVFLSDVPGIFRDKKSPDTLISHLRISECQSLIEQKVIDSGMVPKVEAGIEALRSGVEKVHIVDGREPHSLLLEIFSNQGIGTEIVR